MPTHNVNAPMTPISFDAAHETIGYDAVRRAADVGPDLPYYTILFALSVATCTAIRLGTRRTQRGSPYLSWRSAQKLKALSRLWRPFMAASDLDHEMQGGKSVRFNDRASWGEKLFPKWKRVEWIRRRLVLLAFCILVVC